MPEDHEGLRPVSFAPVLQEVSQGHRADVASFAQIRPAERMRSILNPLALANLSLDSLEASRAAQPLGHGAGVNALGLNSLLEPQLTTSVPQCSLRCEAESLVKPERCFVALVGIETDDATCPLPRSLTHRVGEFEANALTSGKWKNK